MFSPLHYYNPQYNTLIKDIKTQTGTNNIHYIRAIEYIDCITKKRFFFTSDEKIDLLNWDGEILDVISPSQFKDLINQHQLSSLGNFIDVTV